MFQWVDGVFCKEDITETGILIRELHTETGLQVLWDYSYVAQ